MGHRSQTFLWSALGALLVSTPSAAIAQECHAGGRPELPVAVNGALTPDLVPDDIAHAHLVLEAAIGRNAPKTDVARRDALLARIGLSGADAAALTTALSGVKEDLEVTAALAALPQGAPTPDEKRLRDINGRRLKILRDARSRMVAALSLHGQEALEHYVRVTVRPQITVFASE